MDRERLRDDYDRLMGLRDGIMRAQNQNKVEIYVAVTLRVNTDGLVTPYMELMAVLNDKRLGTMLGYVNLSCCRDPLKTDLLC
jgi:hypothetical protein